MKSNVIEGIYNYCDRWCERCRFIERCAVGVEEMVFWEKEKLVKSARERDQLVADTISENFKEVQELLNRIATEKGVDLSTIMEGPDPTYTAQQDRIKAFKEGNETIKLGKKYASCFRKWSKEKLKEIFDSDAYLQAHTLGMKSEADIRQEMADIDDQIAVIRFYSSMIAVKVGRAMRGQFMEEVNQKKIDGEIQCDSNGTAKLAGIMINKSILAWIRLMELVPSCKDDAITHLALLQKLQRDMFETFPMAEHFVRPGFDTH